MALRNCPECSKEVSSYATACPSCGFPIKSPAPTGPLAQCEYCKAMIDAELTECPQCHVQVFKSHRSGYQASNQQQDYRPRRYKSRGTAAALSIFLGGIGIHYFYLEKPGKGLACILFSWTFIPAILGLLTGISIISMTDEKFFKTYEL